MTGKTHLSFGIATTIFLTRPCTIKDLIICITVSSIGAVISDIDINSSKSHKDVEKVITMSITAAVLLAISEYKFDLGIIKTFETNSSIFKILIGVSIFLAICAYGKESPHRTFMHSFLGVFLIGVATYIIYPDAVIYMVISMLSHIFIDLFNKRRVLLFYPYKKGKCFYLCKADGKVNNIVGKLSNVIVILELIGFFMSKGLLTL